MALRRWDFEARLFLLGASIFPAEATVSFFDSASLQSKIHCQQHRPFGKPAPTFVNIIPKQTARKEK